MNAMKWCTRVSARFSSRFFSRSSFGTCANCSLIFLAVRSSTTASTSPERAHLLNKNRDDGAEFVNFGGCELDSHLGYFELDLHEPVALRLRVHFEPLDGRSRGDRVLLCFPDRGTRTLDRRGAMALRLSQLASHDANWCGPGAGERDSSVYRRGQKGRDRYGYDGCVGAATLIASPAEGFAVTRRLAPSRSAVHLRRSAFAAPPFQPPAGFATSLERAWPKATTVEAQGEGTGAEMFCNRSGILEQQDRSKLRFYLKGNTTMSGSNSDNSVSRRGALKVFLVPLAGFVVPKLLSACSDDDPGASDVSDSGSSADAAAARDASAQGSIDASTQGSIDATAGARDAGASTDASASADASVPWASGGTKSMKGGYPDPFATSPGTACTLTKAMILGPCYATTVEREDISEGVAGVPMRLSFLVVRANGCTPVAGATVDIWHTGNVGVYSEFGPGTTCNPGTEDQTTPKFCRGVRTTDANGRTDFNTVIPGWYSGRAVHVHFTVRVNGEEYVTSQLFFDDALLDEIELQPDYKARGTRDTRNTADFVLSGDDAAILSTTKRADGALHAWKVLSLRSSLDEELPSSGGGIPSFPGGDGGFPGGAFPGGAFPEGGFPGAGFPGGGALGTPPSGSSEPDGGR